MELLLYSRKYRIGATFSDLNIFTLSRYFNNRHEQEFLSEEHIAVSGLQEVFCAA